jgi:hypothetical protein
VAGMVILLTSSYSVLMSFLKSLIFIYKVK